VIAEWAGWPKLRRRLHALTLGAVVLGISLSMLHQSGLGALYLMAKGKIHPLWYSEFIPVLFLVSSVFAGLSMVIFEGTISHKVFRDRLGKPLRDGHEAIVIGLARICAGTMFAYLGLQLITFVHQGRGEWLGTGWGSWYLVEIIGLTLLPAIGYLVGAQRRNPSLIRAAAVFSLLGIIINRLNVTVIGFQWNVPVRYVPSWQEVIVTMGVISAEIWVFRWVVNRMPVLDFHIPSRKPESIGSRTATAA
jgi:Ni/Fe-hydrogenase subunit HybB-like protein